MAFSNPSGIAGGAGATQGPDLEVIQTEQLGFLAVAGDAKVQLTPRWDPAPTATAQLLSIASRKGLVAAGGPDAVYVATTEAARKAFEKDKTGDGHVRSFDPQAKIPLSMRISQLAFTTDEQFLVISAETGGGLAVYDVQSLQQGTVQPAFELGTNGETLRALVPNPMPETAGLCALVTNNGNLLMANLSERSLVSGPNGPILRVQVSCAAWSTKGKQIVAGMADGTIQQMTPDGADKASIPKPVQLGDYHVASLSWLENHVFLAIYNATNGQGPSVYHVITRHQAAGTAPSFTFQKLTDPVEPFGADKPPHHTVLRLKDFPPNLQDLLLVSSTCTESIGILSRSKQPLTRDKPAEAITNVFTTTELADDSKRAQLPMSEDLNDTFPVGASLDLSSADKVYKPIPTDEMDESATPIPGLWVLNNEGVLSSWWVVYSESVRQGTVYPGMVAAYAPASSSQPGTGSISTPFGSAVPAPATASAPAPAPGSLSLFGGAATNTVSAFGSSTLLGAKQSPWGSAAASKAPALGSSVFGNTPASSAPAFGAPSSMGSAFGAVSSPGSAFGASSSPAAPAFGQSTSFGIAKKHSPWASGTTSSQPAFGQHGFSSASSGPASTSGKVFGSTASPVITTSPASSGFATFAGTGGFGSLGGSSGGASIFSSKPSNAAEASMDADTAFPPPGSNKSAGLASGSTPFVLGTTFKADRTSLDENENERLGASSRTSFFGGGFGASLSAAAERGAASESKDEDMVSTAQTPALEKPKSIFDVTITTPPTADKPKSIFDNLGSAASKSPFDFRSTTPTATPAGDRFGIGSTGVARSNPFVQQPGSGGTSGLFGQSRPSQFAKPNPNSPLGTPKIKEEDEDDGDNLSKIPAAPLPPDATSKATYALGDSSSDSTLLHDAGSRDLTPSAPDTPSESSLKPKPDAASTRPSSMFGVKAPVEDAPLPPDFTKPASSVPLPVPSVPGSSQDGDLEEEDEEEGDDEEPEEEDDGRDECEEDAASEGSGVDVAKDLSLSNSALGGQTPGFTPQSSFSNMAGSTLTAQPRPETQQRSLFGEARQILPPLPRPVPQSPRSPSPVRRPLSRMGSQRFDPPRSVSAPGMASQIMGRSQMYSKPTSSMSSKPITALDPNIEEQRKIAARKEAEAQAVLEDPEDEGMQMILQSEIEPTLHINEFIAANELPELRDTTGRKNIPVACEALWRDINSMVDRLGLNSRALKSFVLGHSTLGRKGRRTKDDLDSPDDWVLVETVDVGAIVEQDLAWELEGARVNNIEDTQALLRTISKDLVKLRAKEDDMRKIIASHVDPEQAAVAKSMPLSAEQATQQNELRRSYATFAQRLAEAEEGLTLLKVRIASAGGAGLGGLSAGGTRTAVPTVDAIIRTINKMTNMAEKRSGDVDVLETQMRKLRLGSVGVGGSPGPARSREGSPFVGVGTPQKQIGAGRRSVLFMSPERGLRDSVSSSVGLSTSRGGTATPPRKKMSMYSDEEKTAVRLRQAKRARMFALLRTSLERNGPNVQRLSDDD